MHPAPREDVKQPGRLSPGTLIRGLAAFLLAAALILGDVKWYALRQENAHLAAELSELETALEAPEPESPLTRALRLGLRPPTGEQTIPLHIRGAYTGRGNAYSLPQP